ncbi:MAG: hypothetical protein LBG21_02505 [Campylobacteraceae bacterium]|jgi:hypothetical protein|nr:hypothetical protein [Campylobacteraceae bacterium]
MQKNHLSFLQKKEKCVVFKILNIKLYRFFKTLLFIHKKERFYKFFALMLIVLAVCYFYQQPLLVNILYMIFVIIIKKYINIKNKYTKIIFLKQYFLYDLPWLPIWQQNKKYFTGKNVFMLKLIPKCTQIDKYSKKILHLAKIFKIKEVFNIISDIFNIIFQDVEPYLKMKRYLNKNNIINIIYFFDGFCMQKNLLQFAKTKQQYF